MLLPSNVKLILNKLNENGHKSYVVGGCVRDFLMGVTPHDYDICTSATPEQVINIFNDYEVIPTGLKHGTVSVNIAHVLYEITTFRTESEYADGRHPDKVEFVTSILQDLSRRDFTINAIAYNEQDGFVDPFNGQQDIKDKIIRCVGNPEERFKEDALRILRALRFAIKLGFSIEPVTYEQCVLLYPTLTKISIERINSEFTTALMSRKPSDILSNRVSEMLIMMNYALLGAANLHGDQVSVTTRVINYLPDNASLSLRLASVLQPYNIENNLKELKFSNEIVKRTAEISRIGRCLFDNLFASSNDDFLKSLCLHTLNKINYSNVQEIADYVLALAGSTEHESIVKEAVKINNLLIETSKSKVPYKISQLAIDGNHLVVIGITGKQCGEVLSRLLAEVMAGKITNKGHDLLTRAIEISEQGDNI